MLKDYIRALQTSFTTVTGLRDVLIKIFGKVDEEISGKEDALKSITISGTTTSNGNLKISTDNSINIVSIHLDTNNICAIPYTGEDGVYIHALNVVSPVGVSANASISGTAYYK